MSLHIVYLDYRSFKPDFVLIRQHPVDINENWKNIILGLHFGGIPSINSLDSVYNMLDKPWVVSQSFHYLNSRMFIYVLACIS